MLPLPVDDAEFTLNFIRLSRRYKAPPSRPIAREHRLVAVAMERHGVPVGTIAPIFGVAETTVKAWVRASRRGDTLSLLEIEVALWRAMLAQGDSLSAHYARHTVERQYISVFELILPRSTVSHRESIRASRFIRRIVKDDAFYEEVFGPRNRSTPRGTRRASDSLDSCEDRATDSPNFSVLTGGGGQDRVIDVGEGNGAGAN